MTFKLAVVSVVAAVSDSLRARILTGELPPGTPLAETDVAAQYDVARPTAKAAIEGLVRERLLERLAHKTARVVRLSPTDVRDIYRAREIIETEVVRALAHERVIPDPARAANDEIVSLAGASPNVVVEPDMRFHRGLVDAVGSERISRMYEALASEVVLCMSQVQGASLLTTSAIAGEHAHLMRMIEAGDADGAAQALSSHLGNARELLAARLVAVDQR